MFGVTILVKVTFQRYSHQQLVKQTSTIYQLIQSLRDDSLIPENIPNSKLIFRNFNKRLIDGDSKVSDSLVINDDDIHELSIEVKPESQIQQNNSEQIQAMTVRTLQTIVNYLKAGDSKRLIQARLNRNIPPAIAQKLAQIGELFEVQKNQIDFFKATLNALSTSTSNDEMEKRMSDIQDNFMDFVPNQKIKDVKNVAKIIEILRNTIVSKQSSQELMKKDLENKAQEINQLQNKLNRQKNASSQIQIQLSQEKTQIASLKDQIENLNIQIDQKQSEIKNKTSQCDNFKQLEEQLREKLQSEKIIYSNKEKQIKRQLLDNSIKIDELIQNIQQNQQLLKSKDQQMQKIKQNSIDKKILALADNLSVNGMPFPSLNAPKIGRIQDILVEEPLTKDLKKIIQTQMKKPIAQMFELMSYDRRIHRNYSLKQNFQSLIHQKKSLLLVARSEGDDGKLFGAFTEQKYDKQPESYFIPDFNGCSFLFSLIKKELRHFKIQDGENSLTFDLDALVFGNDDLTVDFEKHICSSRFVEGKSNVYNFQTGQGGQANDYRLLLNDKLISEKPQKGKSSVNLVQYKIYQIQFK